MGRRLVASATLLAGLAAGLGIGLLTRSSPAARTVTATTVEVVDGQRSAGPRAAPIPTLLEGADVRGLVLSAAVPPDAELLSAAPVSGRPQQLVVTWRRAHLTRDETAAEWERNARRDPAAGSRRLGDVAP